MAVGKAVYELMKITSPDFAIIDQLHADDVEKCFGLLLPRSVIMSWNDYDKFIHLNDLCAYDQLVFMLGPAVMLGHPGFEMDCARRWRLAVGNHEVIAEGEPDGYRYKVSLRPMKAKERSRRTFA
jgi:hypothetical protein